MVKVTFLKVGYIGTTTIIDALLDERANRKNITVRVVSSGCKMSDEESVDVANIAISIPTDLYVIVSPNASLSGPKKAREIIKETGKPIIVVSDEPSRKSLRDLPEDMGYIVIYADPMIGAKRDLLDPVEMAIFNSDVLKVLAITGVLRLVHTEIDKVIKQIQDGENPTLPRVVVTKKRALNNSGIENPYAYAKAMASFEASRRVANLSTEGTYRAEGKENFLPLVAAAHEAARYAARLADEAREMEKANDSVSRVAHFRSGELRSKSKLFDKYSK
jgi:methylenetetrahydromethanopterin dehydrogenase